MGIFKKKKRDYGYGYSNTLEKMILEDDAPDDEKEKIKSTHAIELYEAFDKVREKKEKNNKVEGKPDYETRKRQENLRHGKSKNYAVFLNASSTICSQKRTRRERERDGAENCDH